MFDTAAIRKLIARLFGNKNPQESLWQASPPDGTSTFVITRPTPTTPQDFLDAVWVVSHTQGIQDLPSIKAIRGDAARIVKERQVGRYFEGLNLGSLLHRSGNFTTIREAPTGRIIPLLELIDWLMFKQRGYIYDFPTTIIVDGSRGLEISTDAGRVISVPECVLVTMPYSKDIPNRQMACGIIELVTKGAVMLTLKDLRHAEKVYVWQIKGVWNTRIDAAD